MSNGKKKKPRLEVRFPTHEELLVYTRGLQARFNEVKSAAAADAELFEQSDREMRSVLSNGERRIEELETSNEELAAALETATDNNTKLQALLEQAERAAKENGLGALINRMDSLLFIASHATGIKLPETESPAEVGLTWPVVPVDTNDGEVMHASAVEDDEDEEEDEDAVDDDAIVDNSGDDEDDSEDEDDDAPEYGELEAAYDRESDVDHNEPVIISGANVNLEPAVDPTVDEMTAAVLPAIRNAIEVLGPNDMEAMFLSPIRRGEITKAHALRQIVSLAFPNNTEIGETIMDTEATRNAVYEALGV